PAKCRLLSAVNSLASLHIPRYNPVIPNSAREVAMPADMTGSGPPTDRAARWGQQALHCLQDNALLVILTAFIIATVAGMVQLYTESTDLFHAVGNVATAVYALGLLVLIFMMRRMRRSSVLLQDAQARTRAIVETVADGVLTLDERGLIDSYNAAAVRIFGHSAEEVAGRHVSMLLPVLTGDQNLTTGDR